MKKLILTQMASDERVPANAMGYIADLHDPNIAKNIEQDRLNQLRKYIPDLVPCVSRKQYQSSTCPATKINCAACKACDKSQHIIPQVGKEEVK